MSKVTQANKILNYSPRKVVSDMRRSPFYNVQDIKESRVNRDGETKTYKRYFIRAVEANG